MNYKNDLNLLQTVFLLDDSNEGDCSTQFCKKRIDILSQFLEELTIRLVDIRGRHVANQQLLFKIHIKSTHSQREYSCNFNDPNAKDTLLRFSLCVNQVILNYLVAYPLGKIQFKWSCNAAEHFIMERCLKKCMKGLDGIFRVAVKAEENVVDLNRFYAISASNMDLATMNVHHDNQWFADCQWCCNTPWV